MPKSVRLHRPLKSAKVKSLSRVLTSKFDCSKSIVGHQCCLTSEDTTYL